MIIFQNIIFYSDKVTMEHGMISTHVLETKFKLAIKAKMTQKQTKKGPWSVTVKMAWYEHIVVFGCKEGECVTHKEVCDLFGKYSEHTFQLGSKAKVTALQFNFNAAAGGSSGTTSIIFLYKSQNTHKELLWTPPTSLDK